MYHFIVNPHSKSGKARALWEKLKKQLIDNNIEFQDYYTVKPGHATEIAREICSNKMELKKIIIVGGDGTANEVINGIDSYEKVLLGYIPTGSSNDLARGMKLSKEPEAALQHILHSTKFKKFDHGVVSYLDNNTIGKFAVGCGMGYDASVCDEVLHSKLKVFFNKIKLGKLTYFAIAVKQVFSTIPCEAELIIDGRDKRMVKNMIFCTAMIHKYEGGGLLMAPHAKPDDKKLSICLVSGIPKLKVLLLMPTIFLGKHSSIKGVELFDCTSLEIISKEKRSVHTDGEVHGPHSHIHLSCTNEQIQMIL